MRPRRTNSSVHDGAGGLRALCDALVPLTLPTITHDTVFTLLNKAGQTKLKKGLLHV
jgi:hypothetical protein